MPTPKQGNAAVMSTFYTMEDCNRDRQSRGHAEEFFCLEYKSDKFIDYTFPQDKQRQGLNDVQPKVSPATGPQAPTDPSNDIQVNGTQYKRVAGAWVPTNEPLVTEVAKPLDVTPKAAEQAPKPRRVAQRPRHDQEAMLEGNPLRVFFNW